MHPYLKKIISKEDQEAAAARMPKKISEMEEPIVKTKIPVTDLDLLRVFFDANDMKDFPIGYYTHYNQNPKLSFNYGENLLCYSTKNATFLTESNIMFMIMKFGSVEKAFMDFREEYKKRL
jgi:hypothetical protein